MKLIGTGYYYLVYDLGNGRVIKCEKNLFRTIKDIYYFEEKKINRTLGASQKLFKNKKQMLALYEHVQKTVPLSMLGNPVFLEGINYEQDKLDLLIESVHMGDEARAKKGIDHYIDFIIEGWKYGFADGVFNFTFNYGLDKSGNVVLADFNEINLTKEGVIHDIETKRWSRAASFLRLDPALQPYYLEQMEKRLTKEVLEENWLKR